MTNNIVKYGAIDIDFDKHSYVFSFKKPKHHDITQSFKNYFKDTKHATVLLSGGLDSQFVANVVHKHTSSYSFVTFAYLWNGAVMNTDDIISAQRFANKLGVTTKIIDIELYEFLNDVSGMKKMGLEIGCNSPQLLCLMYAMQQNMHHLKGTIVKGGERPGVYLTPEGDISLMNMTTSTPKIPRLAGSEHIGLHSYKTYASYVVPFVRFAQQNNIDLVSDLFTASPELFYMGFNQHMAVFEQDNYVSEQVDNFRLLSFYYEKVCFYNSFKDFVYYYPLNKKTGFENLQSFLAAHTGNYDEFDKRYRETLKRTARDNTKVPNLGSIAPKAKGDHAHLLEQLQASYKKHEPTMHTTMYKYTW